MKDNGFLTIGQRRAKGDDAHKVFSVRSPDFIFCNIEEIASRTGRTRNEVVNILLKYALENCKIDSEPPDRPLDFEYKIRPDK